MKLLSWMHHKFWRSTITTADPPKHNISIGNSCSGCFVGFAGDSSFDDGDELKRSYRRSFAVTGHDDKYEEDFVELFHGLLSIGTLGTEPSTPTFSISSYLAGEGEDEGTMNDDPAEKALGLQDDGFQAASFSLRTSHCRAITLSEMTVESGLGGGDICPLSSSTKKGQRTTLGEFFEKSKQMEEDPGTKSNNGENNTNHKESKKTGTNIMKKMLKKRNSVRPCPRSSDSTAIASKLYKILRIFNKKVYPEMLQHPEPKNHSKSKMNNNPHPFDEDIIIYPQQNDAREGCNNRTYLPLLGENHNNDDAVVNEFWVKTDDDYLVLEL